MKKVISKKEFQDLLFDGMSIMIGGFLTNGTPERLIDAVLETSVHHLTIIANDGGYEQGGIGKLISDKRVDHLIASHIGTNPSCGRLMQEGKLKVTLVPQGTLIEQIRAAGAGLGGVLTPTGIHTIVQDNKLVITVQGKDYLLEEPIHADLALIGGCIADKYGNLTYRMSQRNFNPIIALAASNVVASPEAFVDTHDPECVITPHVLVDYILEESHG
ncbi:MAG: 3-oxoacid CoA-transferase subunit A [Candidatus Izemoplasmatales bacterium]|nr:3-oxoacid CoA-transferase subunit A [Candidatus Izemoplasmatales bacterium]